MLVTREADYAIRCVLEVATHGRISAAEVARTRSISRTFLGKIVQTLAKAGIVSTRRGVGGGISLAVAPEDLTLLQIIEAIEGPLVLNECLVSQPDCPQIAVCPAYPYLCEAQRSLRHIFDVTVAEMLRRGAAATAGSGPPSSVTAVAPETVLAAAGNGQVPTVEVVGGDAG
jgi:Rrf2 family transcriptional regulator, iron-sulfur cluster assembly transcription factor